MLKDRRCHLLMGSHFRISSRNPYSLLEYPRIPQNTKRIPKDSQENTKDKFISETCVCWNYHIFTHPGLFNFWISFRSCQVGKTSFRPILYGESLVYNEHSSDCMKRTQRRWERIVSPTATAQKSEPLSLLDKLKHASCSRYQKCRDWFVDRGELFDNQGACQVSLT